MHEYFSKDKDMLVHVLVSIDAAEDDDDVDDGGGFMMFMMTMVMLMLITMIFQIMLIMK